jgi:hypothetical protein
LALAPFRPQRQSVYPDHTKSIGQEEGMHGYKAAVGAAVGTAALLLTLAGAAAFDETKYPDWSGTWKRAPGAGIG